jgi:hypothetical protein
VSHRTQTTVKHWIDLDEREQFDAVKPYTNRTVAVRQLIAVVVDGSLKPTIEGIGSTRLKSGALGMGTDLWFDRWLPDYDRVLAILAAHGIKTPGGKP